MTTAAVLGERSPLLDLLDDAFAPSTLASIAGEAGRNVPWNVWRNALYGPLEDFLSRPGKEFRARLVEHGYRLIRADGSPPPSLTAIVELLHAGSLIVDDIEDGSSKRRGGPALHLSHGVPTALNAGNWLYFLPFVHVARLPFEGETKLAVFNGLGRCLLQCHYGQALDLSAHMGVIPQKHVEAVVETTTRLKTGSLMEFSASVGALAAGAGPVEAGIVGRFGRVLGIGLQMLDDLGGITSDRRCDKGHEDLIGGRPTWPWAWLARDMPAADYEELQGIARQVEARDLHPELLSRRIRARLRGARERVEAHLGKALSDLEGAFGGSPGLADVKQDLAILERSYD